MAHSQCMEDAFCYSTAMISLSCLLFSGTCVILFCFEPKVCFLKMKHAIVLFFIIKLIYLHCKNFRKYRKVVGRKGLWPNNLILPKQNVFCENFDVSPKDCWGAMSRMIWEGPQFTQGNLGSGPAGSSPLSVSIRAAFEGGSSPWQKGLPVGLGVSRCWGAGSLRKSQKQLTPEPRLNI